MASKHQPEMQALSFFTILHFFHTFQNIAEIHSIVFCTRKFPCFPNDFKLARVIPLYKKGSKLDHGSYRPVSILCSMSKVIEKIIFEQIDKYLASHNLLYEFQSGFRKSHSTDTCLLYLTDHIRREVDKGHFCGMKMLDLQRAFDTVDHGIFVCKLKAIGFNDLAVRWVRSYLKDSHWF